MTVASGKDLAVGRQGDEHGGAGRARSFQPDELSAGGRVQALEGIRGVAVMAVLAFHLGYDWARGGYLGVAVFFTLSGFLITTLLLREHGRSGSVDLGHFWSRRTRRLLPLAALGVIGGAIVATAVGTDDGTRGDLWAALANVANWRFILAESSYGDLFAAPSPVLHYWSLGLEAQFYVVFPIVGLLALRRSHHALTWMVIGACALSWALLGVAAWQGWSEFGYYSTPTRLGEILVGSLLALGRRQRGRSPAHLGQTRRWRPPSAAAAISAIAFLAWSFRTVGIDAEDRYLFVLPGVAVATAVLIAVSLRAGPISALLSWRPLCYVGSLSYALYVLHWPVFVWLSPDRIDIGQTRLTVLRLAVTTGLAVAAHHLIERPIMQGRLASHRRSGLVLTLGALVLSASVAAGIVAIVEPSPNLEDLADELAIVTTTLPPNPDVPGRSPTSSSTAATRIAIFGDSTALMTGIGLNRWAANEEALEVVGGVGTLGCGLEPPGARRTGPAAEVEDRSEECRAAVSSWPQAIADSGATVALIQVGPWDAADRRLPGSESWQHLGVATYDEIASEVIATTVDDLHEAGAELVLWVVAPPVHLTRNPVHGPVAAPEGDPARMARLNELATDLAEVRPWMRFVDLAGHLERLGPGADARLRPDGVHFTEAAALEVARWLGPEILRIVHAEDPASGLSG